MNYWDCQQIFREMNQWANDRKFKKNKHQGHGRVGYTRDKNGRYIKATKKHKGKRRKNK